MKQTIITMISLTLLALIFTLGLTFASIELPAVLDRAIARSFNFPNLATGQDQATAVKEQLFIARYHIRLIGYISLALVIGLIAAGFILEKRGLASAGALVLFLPVFGHFAATMFFLGGLAFLRFLWLPFLDISFDLMRLGHAVLLPYEWLLKLGRLVGINLYGELPIIITGLGLFIFLLGVMAWMQGRMRKQGVTQFWIYRLSRHPQYLGWIIWSYGVLFLPGANMKRYVDVPNSLAWLLTSMVIIAVAMMEERRMQRDFKDEYDAFRERSPFMFPMPRFLRRFFSLPLKLVFKRRYPDTKGQIAAVTGFYTVLIICISVFTSGILKNEQAVVNLGEAEVADLARTIRKAETRIGIRRAAVRLSKGGPAAIDSLIAMLKHDQVIVRWYCAQELGSSRSSRAVKPLIALLRDPDSNVRRSAADALGVIGSEEALEPLLAVFLKTGTSWDDSAIARALGKIGSKRAVKPLLLGMDADHSVTRRWCVWALAELGAKEAINPIIFWFENDSSCDFTMAGTALKKLGSDRAEDAFLAGMESGRSYIAQGCIKELGSMGTMRSRDAVIKALGGHPDVKVRRTAVIALGGDTTQAARKSLKQALNDEDFEVRMYAETVLKKGSIQK